MFDPQMELLFTVLSGVVEEPPAGGARPTWADARAALAASGEVEPDLVAAIAAEDAGAVRALLEQWRAGRRHLPEHDREVLKRALKAFRTRLKVTIVDAESSIGGGPMSSGRSSNIVGVVPPERYPRAVWDELVRQKRLVAGRHGMYELPPE